MAHRPFAPTEEGISDLPTLCWSSPEPGQPGSGSGRGAEVAAQLQPLLAGQVEGGRQLLLRVQSRRQSTLPAGQPLQTSLSRERSVDGTLQLRLSPVLGARVTERALHPVRHRAALPNTDTIRSIRHHQYITSLLRRPKAQSSSSSDIINQTNQTSATEICGATSHGTSSHIVSQMNSCDLPLQRSGDRKEVPSQ